MKPQPLINVQDVRHSARFYCDLLGALPGHGGEEYEQILVGSELVLQLHAPRADDNHDVLVDRSRPPGNGVVLWFETDDFAGLLSRIELHGIALDRDPFENVYARQVECWLHDPDGYQVVIVGPSGYPRMPLPEQESSDD
jgi:extradiol dioxygenase family protein